MSSKSNKGVKLSLGEFIGAAGVTTATSSLPKGPAQRAPDDDGSFKRPVRRADNYNDQPPSRSEDDGNWRRGGGGSSSGTPSSGFGASSSGDNYNEQGPSRSEGDGNWRRGGGGMASSGTRDSYVNNRGGSDNDRSSGGYNRDFGSDSKSGNTNNWRGGGTNRENSNPTPSSTGERPRLQLKSRSIPSPAPVADTNSTTTQTLNSPTTDNKTKPNPFGSANAVNTTTKFLELKMAKPTGPPEIELKMVVEPADNNTDKMVVEDLGLIAATPAIVEVKVGDEASENKLSAAKPERKGKISREPEVINSRAAVFGASINPGVNKNESSSDRRENQGPPPILNSRFNVLAEEERERKNERETAVHRDRMVENNEGPPLVVNSRFSAIADADRSQNRLDDRGPPPVANSRFAAAAEADRSFVRPDERGPPPVANSRFAAAAEADRSSSYQSRGNFEGPPPVANSRFAAAADADGRSSFARDDRGPPPVANSRFAAAAALAEDEKLEYEDRRRERDSFYSRDEQNQSRGALPQNSRFAAAAAADSDYVDRENREHSGSRFGDRGEDTYRRGGPGDGNRGSRPMSNGNRTDREFVEPPQTSRVDELLNPKKQDDVLVAPPTKEHEANILKIPEKAFKREEETFLSQPSKKSEKQSTKLEDNAPVSPVISTESMDTLLDEFSSGGKLGEELKEWCASKKPLPPIEKLIFHMLKDREKLNPDPKCEWAEPSKYGAAILYLIEDDVYNQMQVLWAIQLYCATLGFPKVDGDSVVQSMFRAMYKYDLAEADAFINWKEDESDAHEDGKMTTIIQTIEWFAWLEEEDEDEEADADEEEME